MIAQLISCLISTILVLSIAILVALVRIGYNDLYGSIPNIYCLPWLLWYLCGD